MSAKSSRVGVLFALSLVLVAVSFPGAAIGQDPGPRTIAIELVAPPSVEAALQAGLWFEDVEVTDSYCEPAPAGTSSSGGPVLRCDGLPDGSDYRVGLVAPSPDGVLATVNCLDGVGTRTRTPSVPWPSPLGGWVCELWASSPGIVLDSAPFLLADNRPADYAFDVRDSGGTTVSSGCEADELWGRLFRWCTDLPLGDYTVDLVPPTGYRGSLGCGDVGAGGAGTRREIALTAQAPIWSCQTDYMAAPLSAVIRIRDPLALTWARDVRLVVKRADGVDASEFCDVIGISEIAPDPRIPGSSHAIGVDCPGLPAGTYDVGLSGVPDVVDTVVIGGAASCRTEVTDTSEGVCIFELVAARAIPPDPTVQPGPTTSTARSSAVLPRTGSRHSGMSIAALGLLAAGAALITAARRSTRS